MSDVKKLSDKKAHDIQIVGEIISKVFLPLREEELNRISIALRQCNLTPADYAAWVKTYLISMEKDTLPAHSMDTFDWETWCYAFIAYRLGLVDLCGLFSEPRPFSQAVQDNAKIILDSYEGLNQDGVQFLRKLFGLDPQSVVDFTKKSSIIISKK